MRRLAPTHRAGTETTGGRARVLVGVIGAVVAMVLFVGGSAFAYWVYTDSSNTYDTLATAATLSPPTGISATEASATSVNVSWTNPTNPTGTEYLLTQNGTTVCETASNSCPTITGLGVGTTYSYSVDAVLGAHWTSSASATSFTTMAVHITSPTSGSTYGTNWGGTISGTYSAASGTTISAVTVNIQQGSGSSACWAGFSYFYTSCPYAVNATSFSPGSSGTWSLNLPAADLNSGNTYYITAEATDSNSITGSGPTVSFTYNTIGPSPAPPVASATTHYTDSNGVYWVNSETVGLTDSVTYSGAGTVSSVAYYYCTSSLNCNSTTEQFIGNGSGGTWAYSWSSANLPASDGTYYIVAVASDSLSNVAQSSTTEIGIDRTPPTVSTPSVNEIS
jgi:hypothetical protein